jgi:hypothetical protein
MLLENIIEAKDDPENMFLNWEAIVDFLVISLRNPYKRADVWSAYKGL